ncbi:MAG: flavin reductase family protein [Eubacterium sp.]|nr:flavin reductase family protein [Eubacterium sp.]
MGKIDFKPGNMLYPLPAVLVTSRGRDGKDNIITVAWTGTVCTNPPMLYISVRPERYSYQALKETGEFVVNLTTEDMARETDFCGVRSGRDIDKFERTGLHKGEASIVEAPIILESPVNIECRVREEIPLGSHSMFLADVVHVTVEDEYMDQRGTFHLEQANPIVYSHGTYHSIGKGLGSFGYSVRKQRKNRKNKTKN